MKNTIRLFSLPLLAALCLSGCNKPADNTASSGNNGSNGTPAEGQPDKKNGKEIVVGFSQIGAESAWRTAETTSIQDEAKKRGIKLLFSDAQQKQENQLKALNSFLAQGVDVIAFAPVVETGWEPVLQEIKQAGVPVILVDRSISVSDDSLYSTFLGPDPTEEGRKAGRFLAEKTGGKANIAELSGTPGSAPAISRAKGFREIIDKYPDMKIILSQTGDFTRAKGKEVMEAFLKSPEANQITALYAHNDDMALGAIQSIEEAGKKPGKDIIIVSIDGVRGAFDAMVAGKLNCSVECNPLMGPQLFDAVNDLVAGKTVPKHITTVEGMFDEKTAAEALPSRKY